MMAEPTVLQNFSRPGLEGIIESFAEKMAAIITHDGQKLLWPIKDLPEGCSIGSTVRIFLSAGTGDHDEQQQIAKKILNEILKNKD